MGAIGKIAGGIGKKVLGGIGGGGCGSAGGNWDNWQDVVVEKNRERKKLMEIIAQLLNQAKGGCPGRACGLIRK